MSAKYQFILAPMDDVTDTVFRQIVADCSPPDIFFTEFVNVDGLQSPGRDKLMKKLQFSPKEKPIIAQIWGKIPDNYYKTAKELVKMGFAGIDINYGCPDRSVIKNGCCAALIDNRELAKEIIEATKAGAGSLPISVKTRLGLSGIDYSWHEFLLNQDLNMLTIHGRTVKQMSKVPADWLAIAYIRSLRDKISPKTLIIGNGDVMSKEQGIQLADQHKLDGIMIGRGVFHDPYIFSNDSAWVSISQTEKQALYRKHIQLFSETWQQGERAIHTLNKFCKIYINGFDGAKELREDLMAAKSIDQLLTILN